MIINEQGMALAMIINTLMIHMSVLWLDVRTTPIILTFIFACLDYFDLDTNMDIDTIDLKK